MVEFIIPKTVYCATLNCSNYVSFSSWDRDQIGIKLRTTHAAYLKLASFTLNKDVYVNRLESVFFYM